MAASSRLDSILADATRDLPSGVCLEQLARADVDELIGKLAAWYPTIRVGAESRHLEPAFYANRVAFRGEAELRPCYVIVLRAGGELAGMASFEHDEYARSVFGRLVVLDPSRRAAGLGPVLGPRLSEQLGRALGAELLVTTTTMHHSHGQRLLEQAGFRLVGVIPGYDRDQLADGTVKRVCEAMYAKLLVASDQVLAPSPTAMSVRVAAVFELVNRDD